MSQQNEIRKYYNLKQQKDILKRTNYHSIPLTTCSHIWGPQGCYRLGQNTSLEPNLQDVVILRCMISISLWSTKTNKIEEKINKSHIFQKNSL